ncbi:hypothetical protein PInf_009668 [Phytophthora infestans]|nr:hypothetical protein PInf_010557 [Phytophthora infestans]KAI9981888.1 hypothetical protein PInf_009668 [Phytophthora infestans]
MKTLPNAQTDADDSYLYIKLAVIGDMNSSASASVLAEAQGELQRVALQPQLVVHVHPTHKGEQEGHYPGNTRTCYAIWHNLWRNGRDRPKPRCGRGIQMRPPGKKAGNAGEASTEGGATSENETVGDDEGSSDGDTTPE